jgi:phosphoglycerate dehydrogenase-like enzyme
MIGPVAICEVFASAMQDRIRAAAGEGLDLVFPNSAEDLNGIVADAAYLVVRAVALPEPVLDVAPRVRLIHQWGTGTDGIPVTRARARGIAIARCTGVNAPSVADLTIGLMLAACRWIPQCDAGMRKGNWPIDVFSDRAFDLCEARVGLVGFGAIGQEVARRLSAFGSELSYFRASGAIDRGESVYRPLDELLEWADVISLHVPLTVGTRGLIDGRRLTLMHDGAVLVNTSRGGIVDEPALVDALSGGRLIAALDVFADEPLHPRSSLRRLENVVLTPHVGGRTRDNLRRMVAHWANNIRRFDATGEVPERDRVQIAAESG